MHFFFFIFFVYMYLSAKPSLIEYYDLPMVDVHEYYYDSCTSHQSLRLMTWLVVLVTLLSCPQHYHTISTSKKVKVK